VLARVGDALLGDAVDDAGRGGRQRAGAILEIDALAGLDASVHECRHVGEWFAAIGRRDMQDAEDRTQLLQRFAGRDPDQRRTLPHLSRSLAGVQLQRTGVQCDERHLVRQHIVHLPGDPVALGGPRLVVTQLPFDLGALGLVAKRRDQRMAGGHIDADGDDQSREQRRRSNVVEP
jgi:hypothetical protein